MNQESYPLVVPRLIFNRQCGQALELYREVFGATVKEKLLFSEADPRDFQYKNKEDKDLIYYALMMIGTHQIMLHDDNNRMLINGEAGKPAASTALCVSFDSEEKARDAYQKLSDGATILMPVTSTTFGSFHTTLIDKFGIVWDLYFGSP